MHGFGTLMQEDFLSEKGVKHYEEQRAKMRDTGGATSCPLPACRCFSVDDDLACVLWKRRIVVEKLSFDVEMVDV